MNMKKIILGLTAAAVVGTIVSLSGSRNTPNAPMQIQATTAVQKTAPAVKRTTISIMVEP
jgi:hypothetical protein